MKENQSLGDVVLIKKLPVNILTACILSGLSGHAMASAPQSFHFSGQDTYKVTAVDVFRLRKDFPEVNVTKALRPIFGEVFYTEDTFKSALSTQLDSATVEKIYSNIKARATQKSKQLSIFVHSDNALQITYQDADEKASFKHSDLIDLSKFKAPSKVKKTKHGFNTPALDVSVDEQTLCISFENQKDNQLSEICPDTNAAFTVSADEQYRLNGLGQEFQNPGVVDSSWNGKVRHSNNRMEGFNGGGTGNTMFPILYASSPNQTDFAVYLDNMYSTQWDFSQSPWKIKSAQGDVNLFYFAAESLPELRQSYMSMVGNPLVPPRKMFGMWLSEYGFDNWKEMDRKLETLASNEFPIDGVVMDLQWFGNVQPYDPMSHMGTLTWDEDNFPKPKQKIAQLKDDGIGMMLIEESYVSRDLEEHSIMEESGFLARDPKTGKAINTNSDGGGYWWGKGGMIDWTNKEAGIKWHDWKRQPLIDMGVIGHWTDLGEPEMYNSNGIYAGDQGHNEIHNIFNYKWLESIYQGYQRNDVSQRPFMMSRSGAPGIQRFGASMWSGDIGSNLTSLSVQLGMQTNMMLSGMDYYGSDIGGFHRAGLGVPSKDKDAALAETYTQWFAYSSLFDVPVRPHTENLCNCKETAPDRVGDLESNKSNLELRYQLIPYIYSNAHTAHLTNAPVFPSLGFEFGNDPKAVTLSNHKMMGESLLSVAVAKLGQKNVDVYLPKGKWFDFRTGESYNSDTGIELKEQPLYSELKGEALFQLPLYAKEGAIVPFNPAASGKLTSDVPETIALKVFGLPQHSEFTLYEDDGVTNEYLDGDLRRTLIKLDTKKSEAKLTLTTSGTYEGAPQLRPILVEWQLDGLSAAKVELNGEKITSWKMQGNTLELAIDAQNVSHQQTIIVSY